MFKTLLASTFLLFNVSNSVPQKNANEINSVYSSYCLKDIYNEDNYNGESFSFSLYDYARFNDEETRPYVYLDDEQFLYCKLESITISYQAQNYVQFRIFYYTMYDSNLATLLFEYHWNEDLTDGYDDNYKYFIIYFPQHIYLNDNQMKVFNNIFTGGGNNFVHYYNGYFTYTSLTGQYDYAFAGNILVNNQLFNYYSFYGGEGNATLLGTDFSNNFIHNRKFTGTNLLYLNGVLINDDAFQKMQRMGVFSYVYEPQQYTFGEMIFNIIDAPVYMLTRLFDFELFGIQFYVAFMSIVTVILICFVLKKII